MNRILFLSILLMTSMLAYSQRDKKDSLMNQENIKVVSRYRNGGVELRLYPTNMGTWRKSNQLGYSIKRMELSDAGAAAGFKELTVLKPYSGAEGRNLASGDSLAKATLELIASRPTSKNVVDIENEESEAFFTYILATSLSAKAAKVAGMLYTDNTIEKGKQYVYNISIISTKAKKDPNDEVLVFMTDTQNDYVAPSPQEVSAEEGEGVVKLSWNNTSNKELFAAYDIERSSNGGKSFTKITKIPFLALTKDADVNYYTDSVKNYIPYQYRVIGITLWVDHSNPSEIVEAMGRDKTAPSPPMNVQAKGDRKKILVTWELPAQSRDLKGFQIARGKKLEGPFTSISDKATLLGVSQRTFTDPNPVPKEPYYVVYSVDTAGNFNSTFSVMAIINDTVPPMRPLGFNGGIDSNGVVKLNWKYGSDNDLIGYQVYVANGKDNVYRQLTGSPIGDTTFADTVSMRSLTRDVFYKITAIDYNNNASDYSEILTLKRPDVIPPAAPMISSYAITESSVRLVLTASSSDDVAKYHLVRTDVAGKKQTIGDWREIQTAVEDKDVKEGAEYTYTLLAIDGSGKTTPSSPIRITVLEQSIKPGVDGLTAKFDEAEKKVMLQWRFDQPGTGYSFVLFSRNNDGEWNAVKNLPASAKQFTQTVTARGKIEYAIKVMYTNGAESTLSTPAIIETKL